MINLYSYDTVDERKKPNTIVLKSRKVIVSRDIKYRPYYTLLKKFDPNTGTTHYYICMLDEPDSIRKCVKTILDDYGRTRIYLDGYFNEILENSLIDDKYLNVKQEETADNADVYLIEHK